jgi:hypothetical protein
MAHEHPTLLRRLVDKLNAPWTEIIIHIDRKIDITIFEDALAGCNVVFLPDQLRVDIRWGGISQCRATLQMLRYAMDFTV